MNFQYIKILLLENIIFLITFFSAIQNYGEHYSSTGEFETYAFFRALSDFFGIFMLSLLIGALMGCFTALISF